MGGIFCTPRFSFPAVSFKIFQRGPCARDSISGKYTVARPDYSSCFTEHVGSHPLFLSFFFFFFFLNQESFCSMSCRENSYTDNKDILVYFNLKC